MSVYTDKPLLYLAKEEEDTAEEVINGCRNAEFTHCYNGTTEGRIKGCWNAELTHLLWQY